MSDLEAIRACVQQRLALTDLERASLAAMHDFHGRQMPDPDGAYHRERAAYWRAQEPKGG